MLKTKREPVKDSASKIPANTCGGRPTSAQKKEAAANAVHAALAAAMGPKRKAVRAAPKPDPKPDPKPADPKPSAGAGAGAGAGEVKVAKKSIKPKAKIKEVQKRVRKAVVAAESVLASQESDKVEVFATIIADGHFKEFPFAKITDSQRIEMAKAGKLIKTGKDKATRRQVDAFVSEWKKQTLHYESFGSRVTGVIIGQGLHFHAGETLETVSLDDFTYCAATRPEVTAVREAIFLGQFQVVLQNGWHGSSVGQAPTSILHRASFAFSSYGRDPIVQRARRSSKSPKD